MGRYRLYPIDHPDRIWSKIEVATSGCWIWTASGTPDGYGSVRHNGTTARAHRVVYELLVGPIPEGLTLDHLCNTTRCVNPTHQVPATQRENILRGNAMGARHARKTHCDNGHPFDLLNTRISSRGWRVCRACETAKKKRKREAA